MSSVARQGTREFSRGRVGPVLVSILLLVFALISALVFVIAAGLLEPAAVISDPSTRQTLLGPITSSSIARIAFAIGSLAIGLGSLALLVSRGSGARSAGRRLGGHVVTADDAGLVVISSAGIASLVTHAVLRTQGVVDAEVTVKGRGAAPIGIRVDTVTRAGSDVDGTGKAVRDAARAAAEKLGGLEVADVVVSLEVLSPEDMGMRVL